jgi:transcriptional regulator with XRE-family HTH domain
MARVSRTRPRVDDSPLAREIGERLRKARLDAGMTQQQLAEGRYTKAYISALENGLSRPSMAALNYLSGRLGIPASTLLNEQPATWARLEADLALACGRWGDAVTAYEELLAGATARETRAELLAGLAEAQYRRGNGSRAATAAAEAADIFHKIYREADAALAEYWLAASQFQLENSVEATALLQGILARVRAGLKVEPDFHLRLVMALSTIQSRDGNHSAALAYLDEVRALASEMDDRRRAIYLQELAYSYRETGDYEAAVRSGIASLELFRQVQSEGETAALENDLALSYLALGNASRAAEMIASARATLERLDDGWTLSHILDTQAQIALAKGSPAESAAIATQALEHATRAKNAKAMVSSLLTLAHARSAEGDAEAALAAYERAGGLARDAENSGLIRKALREWADALAAAGKHEQAFAVMREALADS